MLYLITRHILILVWDAVELGTVATIIDLLSARHARPSTSIARPARHADRHWLLSCWLAFFVGWSVLGGVGRLFF